jgi:hypothetical protein
MLYEMAEELVAHEEVFLQSSALVDKLLMTSENCWTRQQQALKDMESKTVWGSDTFCIH